MENDAMLLNMRRGRLALLRAGLERRQLLAACGALLFAVSLGLQPCHAVEPRPALIPTPKQMTWKEGGFVLNGEARIVIPHGASGDVRLAADALARAIDELAGQKVQVLENDAAGQGKGVFVLRPGLRDAQLGAEGYRLQIGERVLAEAKDGRGLFYAVQTLRQMILRNGHPGIPCAEIRDWPSWPYRGIMLDPARNYMTVEFLKRQIDVLSSYKLNYFHLHLTDSNAWRPEIRAYPQLVSEKHYTQEQLKDLVAYAKARCVTLVPEIEMPGHSQAFIDKLPELGHHGIMCLGNEKLYGTLETVWREMAGVFPGPYLHVGGDETNDDPTCKLCKSKWDALRQSADPPGSLVVYFLSRLNGIIKGLDLQMVAWSVDTRHWSGVLPKDVVVMSWTSNAVDLARQGYPTINTYVKPLYFDHFHPIKTFLDWVPNQGASDSPPALLGAEGEAWHDPPVKDEQDVVTHLGFYPRLMALAEQVWGPPGGATRTDLAGFESRLLEHKARLFRGAAFAYPPPSGDPCRQKQ
jgi:hexosaminidase